MAETTSTPSGVSKNGYLKDIKTHEDVPSICSADLSIDKNRENILNNYDNEGDAFSGNAGTAIVNGDDILLGEVSLLIGDINKDAPNKKYQEFKNEKMEKSAKDKQAHEENKIDRNNDGIDDRIQ